MDWRCEKVLKLKLIGGGIGGKDEVDCSRKDRYNEMELCIHKWKKYCGLKL